jgi:hypothetical protein
MDIFILSIYIKNTNNYITKKTVLFPELSKLFDFMKNKYYTTNLIENENEYNIEYILHTNKVYIKTIGIETLTIQKISIADINKETYQEDVKIPYR